MCHIFVSLDAAFHADPSSLKGMGAPRIPVLIGELFPINLRIVMHVQGVDPVDRLFNLVLEAERNDCSLMYQDICV